MESVAMNIRTAIFMCVIRSYAEASSGAHMYDLLTTWSTYRANCTIQNHSLFSNSLTRHKSSFLMSGRVLSEPNYIAECDFGITCPFDMEIFTVNAFRAGKWIWHLYDGRAACIGTFLLLGFLQSSYFVLLSLCNLPLPYC